jgi:hypothetical protein
MERRRDRDQVEKMNNRRWIIATFAMLVAAAFFIANGHTPEPSGDLPDPVQIESANE